MIEQYKGTIRGVAWTELFPWLIIARSFRLAISLRSLIFGAIGILLMYTGWGIISMAFSSSENTPPICPWTSIVNMVDNAPAVTLEGTLKTPGGQNPITYSWNCLTSPSREGLIIMSGRLDDAVYILLQGLWGVMVWAFFGTAICRTAAVQLAANEQLGFMAAVRFAVRKWLAFVAAPLMPVGGVLLITIPILILGWIMLANGFILLGGIVWPLVLVVGFVMTLLLVGLLFGWPLMWATISTEGTDSFDALSRSYAYTFQRPLHYLFYASVAAFLGWLGWILVKNFAAGIVWMSYWAANWGCGSDQITAILGQGNQQLEGINWFGAGMIRFFAGCVKLLAVGFLFSYFWTASTSIYLLLRRDVDATEMDEVYLDSDATEQDSSLPAIPQPESFAKSEKSVFAANGNVTDEAE